MKYFLILSSVLLYLSACSTKDVKTPSENSGIVGSWGLLDSLQVDGVGLIFQSDGTVTYRKYGVVQQIDYVRYEVVNDSVLTFFRPGNNTPTRAAFHIDGYLLKIEGACISSCSELYQRVLPID